MATYIILSRFSPEAFRDPKDFKELAKEVSTKIKSECPGVKWKDSFATLGRFDVVVVEADDPKQIEKAAMVIRAYGHSTTETLVARRGKSSWQRSSRYPSAAIAIRRWPGVPVREAGGSVERRALDAPLPRVQGAAKCLSE